MDKKPKILIFKLECPKAGLLSQVVEDALEDALESALRHGDCIDAGLFLGVYTKNLEDQFYEHDGYVTFNGNDQEVLNFNRERHGCMQQYMVEFTTALRSIASLNEPVIELAQKLHWKDQLYLARRLPNHWLIAVEKKEADHGPKTCF